MTDTAKSRKYVDPSGQLWSNYITEAEKYDKSLAYNWKGDMDSILIFAGLFSASVTALLIESYQNLTPDPQDTMIYLLSRISQQISFLTNNSDIPPLNIPTIDPSIFQPTVSSRACNILWFLSLGFSLTCALSATLVEHWTRNYLQATQSRSTPHHRARISSFLYFGLKKFGMHAIVETIPLLLHLSLLLFFAGLVEFLLPVNAIVSNVIFGFLLLCGVLYLLVTILPIFFYDCPFRTPLSPVWFRILCTLRLIQTTDELGVSKPITCSLNEIRELEAIKISFERDHRDFRSMSWAISALRGDSELEPFVEIIPDVVAANDYSGKLLLHKLLHHGDPSVRLGSRLSSLLVTCINSRLDSSHVIPRAVTCLRAIWSLTMMSVPVRDGTAPQNFARGSLQFDTQTLSHIRALKAYVPNVSKYAVSTLTVISRSLLDIHIDQLSLLEDELMWFETTGKWSPSRISIDGHLPTKGFPQSSRVISRIIEEIARLEEYILDQREISSHDIYLMVDCLLQYINEFVNIISGDTDRSMDYWARDARIFCRDIRRILNQAGFSLLLEYISHILEGDTLPHEAFNTLRRLLFKVKLGDPDMRLSSQSQTQLVHFLDTALEPRMHGVKLSDSIINVLLDLVRALDDPTVVGRAHTIIARHSQYSSNVDAAHKALSTLRKFLPERDEFSEILDIFSSHIYSDSQPQDVSLPVVFRPLSDGITNHGEVVNLSHLKIELPVNAFMIL